MRIGVVATGKSLDRSAVAEPVRALASAIDPDVRIDFHPQCFESSGHFAGTDERRREAFLEYANDPAFDAIWFGRGGYGTCRVAEHILPRLGEAARDKIYLGYSDAGYLLAGLYRNGFNVAHGPMPGDMASQGPEPVERALKWLIRRDPASLEPGLGDAPAAAFNMIVFSQLLGTPLEPDLSGHVLLLEEVDEYMYEIDRSLYHISFNPSVRRIAGLRLGRCIGADGNDLDFVESEEEVARRWCSESGIAWLGRADIGHDRDNKVVPFGRP
jgi:muramoyltetrapeptide carboxypeptidase